MLTSGAALLSSATAADLRVRDAVIQELDWDPRFDAATIGVSARNGAVTLTGSIDSYSGKLAAARAAKRVRGVRVVANDVQVTLRHERKDPDIATDIVREFGLRSKAMPDVQAVVHDGRVTLTGTVKSLFHRTAAERAIRHVPGVKGVVNHVTVARAAPDLDRLIGAIARTAGVPHRAVCVEVSDDLVTLKGEVPSWRARDAAEDAVRLGTGVGRIDNQIVVIESEADNVNNDIC
jgi:osmotically-inducible protein OsmY